MKNLILACLILASALRVNAAPLWSASFENGEINPGGADSATGNTTPYPAAPHAIADGQYGWASKAYNIGDARSYSSNLNVLALSGANAARIMNRTFRTDIPVPIAANSLYTFTIHYLVNADTDFDNNSKIQLRQRLLDIDNGSYLLADTHPEAITAGVPVDPTTATHGMWKTARAFWNSAGYAGAGATHRFRIVTQIGDAWNGDAGPHQYDGGAYLDAMSFSVMPVVTWNGGSGDNWSTAANWATGVAPVNGDDVAFLVAAGNPLTSTVDSAISVNSLTRTWVGSNSVMTVNTLGNLTLNGDITTVMGGLQLVGPITLATNITVARTIAANTAAGNTALGITFTNAPGDAAGISGNYSIAFNNADVGGSSINCDNPLSTWSGGAQVKYGDVRLNNVSSTGSPGAPTAGPLGTGTVTLGSTGEVNQAVLVWAGSADQILHNNLVVASSGGTANARTLANNLTAPLKLTLSGGVATSDDLFLAGAANNTTRFDGDITGSGAVVVNAANLNVLLMGNNSYAGGTRVVGNGFLGFGDNSALGTGPVTLGDSVGSGQVWSYALNGARTITNDVTIKAVRYIVASGSVDGLAGNDLTFNGSVTMDHGSVNVRDIYLQKNLTINGELKSANPDNALRITGGGKLTLTGVNSYEGGTFINSATLNINSDAALGADPGFPSANLTFSGGGGTLQVGAASVTLSANRNIDIGAATTIDTSGNHLTINGVMSGGANFTKLGGGMLTFTGTGNSVGGYAFLDGDVVVSGGTFDDGLEFLVGWTAPGTMTLSGPTASSRAVTARLGNGANSGTVNLEGGTLQVDQVFALAPPATTGTTVINFDGGRLTPWGVQPARFPTYISGLTHAYVKAGGVTLDTGVWSLTIPQALEHDPALGATPDGGLTKDGSGDLILAGTNTYTGLTTVNSGRLTVMPHTGATGAYSVADGAKYEVKLVSAGTTLTNASLALGLFGGSGLEIDLNSLPLTTVPPLRVTGALDPNGTTTLTLKGFPGSATPGVFPLIQYGSLGGIGFGSFFLDPIPNVGASLSNDTVNAMIVLVVTDVDFPKWKGNWNNDWDINFTPNWVGVGSGTPTTYQEPSVPGAPVLFDDSADTGTVNLTTTLSPYSITVSNDVIPYTFSGLGNLAGPGGLTKRGPGQLQLETANSYNGGNTLLGGSVVAAAAYALGSGGALTVNNATLNLGDYNQSVGLITLTNGTITGLSGVLTASGYSLASGTISAHVASGNMAKISAGTVSLTAGNTIGATTISGGILRVTDAAALAPGGFNAGTMTTIQVGGALEYDGTMDSDEHISFVGTGPDGQGALRLLNGLMNHNMHIAMSGDATLRVGPGAYLLHTHHLYTTGDPITLIKAGEGQFWIVAYSYPQIALDVTEGTLGAWGNAAGMVTVRSNATLAGIGVINGPVTVLPGGKLTPGVGEPGYEAYQLSPLTCTSNVTLQGMTFMEIGKNSGVTTNDQVKGIVTLNLGGTLVVTNLGADPLAAGDTFQLFLAGTYNGSFASVTLPPLDAGLAWADDLAVNGTIQVVVAAPALGGVIRLGDGNIQFSGTGPTNAAYRVLASTNIAESLSNWLQVGSGTFTNGLLNFTDLQATNHPQRFYRAVTP